MVDAGEPLRDETPYLLNALTQVGLRSEGFVGRITEAGVEDGGVADKEVDLGCPSLAEALGD